ncbi:MAG: hypothetical protein U1E47_05840 [Rivihabitans pingtungensis]
MIAACQRQGRAPAGAGGRAGRGRTPPDYQQTKAQGEAAPMNSGLD